MKTRNARPRTLVFDASCRGCLQRIVNREDLVLEVVSDAGYHRGWVHVECADELEPDAPPDDGPTNAT